MTDSLSGMETDSKPIPPGLNPKHKQVALKKKRHQLVACHREKRIAANRWPPLVDTMDIMWFVLVLIFCIINTLLCEGAEVELICPEVIFLFRPLKCVFSWFSPFHIFQIYLWVFSLRH